MSSPLATGALCALLMPLTFVAASSAPTGDPDLYVAAGCASCHGSSAGGAYGPTLAGTHLSFDAFLKQLREPRGVMPAVPESAVSDDQARSLFDFVRQLDAPEGGVVAGSGCMHGGHGPGSHGACRHGACRRGACRGGACRGGRSAGG